MTKVITIGQHVVDWVAARMVARFSGADAGIGLLTEEGLVAGVVFEGYNHTSIIAHIASDGSKRWANREFLHFVCWYPFVQLECERVTVPVFEGNNEGVKFVEHMGFTLEATLPRACPTGAVYLYRMFKEDCRWLKIPVRYSGGVEDGQGQQRTSNA